MPGILIVDDERHILKILAEPLTKRGYTVLTAESGREAVQKAMQERPDLLVLDFILPDMIGVEVIGRLRTHPELLELPIILLTCRGPEPDLVAYMEAYTEENVVAKLQKPMSPLVLLDEIRKALDKKNATPSPNC